MVKKIIAFVISFCFLFEQIGFAQVMTVVPLPSAAGAMGAEKFRPMHLRSLSYDALANNFDLLLDKGDTKAPELPQIQDTTEKLLEYFKIGLTLPNSAFWVNLRPDEQKEIIDPDLEKTELGKVLLEADLQLKKDTAAFTSPQTREGREYWNKLYQKAQEIFGSDAISIPTLTRPWIVPGEILISQTKNESSAYVYKATLKVMLEQDYLKDSATYNFKDARSKELNEYSSELIRNLIIPKLTKEINSAKRYAPLRQVYYSLILAQWFKEHFRGGQGQYASMIDQKDLTGISSRVQWSKDTYFQEYQKSFKDGEYNTKESRYTASGQSVRSYFSGGINLADGGSVATYITGGATFLRPNTLGLRVDGRDFNIRQLRDGGSRVEPTQSATTNSFEPTKIALIKAGIIIPKVIETWHFLTGEAPFRTRHKGYELNKDFAKNGGQLKDGGSAEPGVVKGSIGKIVDAYRYGQIRRLDTQSEGLDKQIGELNRKKRALENIIKNLTEKSKYIFLGDSEGVGVQISAEYTRQKDRAKRDLRVLEIKTQKLVAKRSEIQARSQVLKAKRFIQTLANRDSQANRDGGTVQSKDGGSAQGRIITPRQTVHALIGTLIFTAIWSLVIKPFFFSNIPLLVVTASCLMGALIGKVIYNRANNNIALWGFVSTLGYMCIWAVTVWPAMQMPFLVPGLSFVAGILDAVWGGNSERGASDKVESLASTITGVNGKGSREIDKQFKEIYNTIKEGKYTAEELQRVAGLVREAKLVPTFFHNGPGLRLTIGTAFLFGGFALALLPVFILGITALTSSSVILAAIIGAILGVIGARTLGKVMDERSAYFEREAHMRAYEENVLKLLGASNRDGDKAKDGGSVEVQAANKPKNIFARPFIALWKIMVNPTLLNKYTKILNDHQAVRSDSEKAARILGELGDIRAVKPLRRYLVEVVLGDDYEVAPAAEKALRQLGLSNGDMELIYIMAFQNTSNHRLIRKNAVEILGRKVGRERALFVFASHFVEKDLIVKRAIDEATTEISRRLEKDRASRDGDALVGNRDMVGLALKPDGSVAITGKLPYDNQGSSMTGIISAPANLAAEFARTGTKSLQELVEYYGIARLVKEIDKLIRNQAYDAAKNQAQELTKLNRYRGLEAQLRIAQAMGDMELASRISDEMLNEPLPVDSLPDMDFGSKDLAKDGGSMRTGLSGIIYRYKGLPLDEKLFLTDEEIAVVLSAMNSKDPVVKALLAKIGDREFTADTNKRFFAKVYPQIEGPLDEIDWRLTVNQDGGRMTVRQTVAENLRKFRENKNWKTAFDNSKGSLIIDVGSSRKKEGYMPAIFGLIDKNGRLFYVSNTPELIDMILSGRNKDLYEFNVKGDIIIVDDRLYRDADVFRVKSILKATFKMLDREMAASAVAKDGGTVLLEKLNAVKEQVKQNSGLDAIGVGRDQKAKIRISNADFVAFIFYPDRFNEKRVYILRQGEQHYILTDDGKSEELLIGKAIDRNYPQQIALSSNVQDVYLKVLSGHLFLDITPATCNIEVLAPKNTIFSWDAKQELYTPYAANKQDGGVKVFDMKNQRSVTDLILALYQAIRNENGKLAGEIAQSLGGLGDPDPAAKEALETLVRSENLNDAWFAHNEAQAALRHLTQVSDLERTIQDGGKEGESLEGFRKRAEELFGQGEYTQLLKLATEIEDAFPGSELAATAKAKAEFELGISNRAADGGSTPTVDELKTDLPIRVKGETDKQMYSGPAAGSIGETNRGDNTVFDGGNRKVLDVDSLQKDFSALLDLLNVRVINYSLTNEPRYVKGLFGMMEQLSAFDRHTDFGPGSRERLRYLFTDLATELRDLILKQDRQVLLAAEESQTDDVILNFRFDGESGFWFLSASGKGRYDTLVDSAQKFLLPEGLKLLYSMHPWAFSVSLKELMRAMQIEVATQKIDQGLDGGNKDANTVGGIDFRALPAMNQPMGNYLKSIFTPQPNITIGSLDEEWNSISRLAQMNVFPSSQRIKEFLWCCYQRGELNQRTTDVLVCLGEVLRLEEEQAKPTEPDVKDMLVLLEANRQS